MRAMCWDEYAGSHGARGRIIAFIFRSRAERRDLGRSSSTRERNRDSRLRLETLPPVTLGSLGGGHTSAASSLHRAEPGFSDSRSKHSTVPLVCVYCIPSHLTGTRRLARRRHSPAPTSERELSMSGAQRRCIGSSLSDTHTHTSAVVDDVTIDPQRVLHSGTRVRAGPRGVRLA